MGQVRNLPLVCFGDDV